jgi:hypothetical protein
MDLSARRVHIAGIACRVNGLWTAQVGRNVTDEGDGFLRGKRYLIHDRDPLYADEFLRILGDARVESVKLPQRRRSRNAHPRRPPMERHRHFRPHRAGRLLACRSASRRKPRCSACISGGMRLCLNAGASSTTSGSAATHAKSDARGGFCVIVLAVTLRGGRPWVGGGRRGRRGRNWRLARPRRGGRRRRPGSGGRRASCRRRGRRRCGRPRRRDRRRW